MQEWLSAVMQSKPNEAGFPVLPAMTIFPPSSTFPAINPSAQFRQRSIRKNGLPLRSPTRKSIRLTSFAQDPERVKRVEGQLGEAGDLAQLESVNNPNTTHVNTRGQASDRFLPAVFA